MDALVRDINYYLPNGWLVSAGAPNTNANTSKRVRFLTSSVYANWMTKIQICDLRWEPNAKLVWRSLKESAPPVGWKPTDIDDPFIAAAFTKAWPEA
jgi:hypothetical protein